MCFCVCYDLIKHERRNENRFDVLGALTRRMEGAIVDVAGTVLGGNGGDGAAARLGFGDWRTVRVDRVQCRNLAGRTGQYSFVCSSVLP